MISKTMSKMVFEDYRRDIEALAKKHGLSVDKSICRWNDGEIRFRTIMKPTVSLAVALQNERVNFNEQASTCPGLRGSFGKTIEFRGRMFKIVGWNNKARTRKIQLMRLSDEQSFRASVSVVREALEDAAV